MTTPAHPAAAIVGQAEPTLTELDHVRLLALARRGTPVPAELRGLLDEADLVPSRDVGPDVVTMYSQVRLAEPGQPERSLTVCWPQDADPEAGRVSVLSPLGAALLGRRVGERVRWGAAEAPQHEALISALLYQPEASGDYLR